MHFFPQRFPVVALLLDILSLLVKYLVPRPKRFGTSSRGTVFLFVFFSYRRRRFFFFSPSFNSPRNAVCLDSRGWRTVLSPFDLFRSFVTVPATVALGSHPGLACYPPTLSPFFVTPPHLKGPKLFHNLRSIGASPPLFVSAVFRTDSFTLKF